MNNTTAIQRTLRLGNPIAFLFEFLFIVVGILLPMAVHALKINYLVILPMHWAILCAGLVYGWLGGSIVALLVPAISFAVSGMPPLAVLPIMTVEVLAYGFVTGILAQKTKMPLWLALAIAIVTGRLMFFTLSALFLGQAGFVNYARETVLPGILSILGQILFLPSFSRLWMTRT